MLNNSVWNESKYLLINRQMDLSLLKTVRPALTASFLFHAFILAVPSSYIRDGVPLLLTGFNVDEGQNR